MSPPIVVGGVVGSVGSPTKLTRAYDEGLVRRQLSLASDLRLHCRQFARVIKVPLERFVTSKVGIGTDVSGERIRFAPMLTLSGNDRRGYILLNQIAYGSELPKRPGVPLSGVLPTQIGQKSHAMYGKAGELHSARKDLCSNFR